MVFCIAANAELSGRLCLSALNDLLEMLAEDNALRLLKNQAFLSSQTLTDFEEKANLKTNE